MTDEDTPVDDTRASGDGAKPTGDGSRDDGRRDGDRSREDGRRDGEGSRDDGQRDSDVADGRGPPITRRAALTSLGVAGLFGFGTTAASADPQGEVGSGTDPVKRLYAEELNGGVTGGTALTDLAGDGLALSGNALTADLGTGLEFAGGAARVDPGGIVGTGLTEEGPTSLGVAGDGVTGTEIDLESIAGNNLSVDASNDELDAGGSAAWADGDGDDLLEPSGSSITGIDNTRTVRSDGSLDLVLTSGAVEGGGSESLEVTEASGDNTLLTLTEALGTTNPSSNFVVGRFNDANDGAKGVTISGGGSDGVHDVFDDFGTIGGGNGNQAGSDDGDSTTAQRATVAGGGYNEASGTESTVAGGRSNTASGDQATVAGGKSNEATATYATVPGGSYNLADGAYSFAAGRETVANGYDGAFVWGDSSLSTVSAGGTDEVRFQATGGFVVENSAESTESVTLDGGLPSGSGDSVAINASGELVTDTSDGGGGGLWTDSGDDGLLNPSDSGDTGIEVTDVQTDSLNGGVTGDTDLTSLTGDGLTVSSGALTADIGSGLEFFNGKTRVDGGAVAGNVLSENGSNPHQIDLDIGSALTDDSGSLAVASGGIGSDEIATDGVTGAEIDLSTIAGDNLTVDTAKNELDGLTPALADNDSDALLETADGEDGISVSTVQVTNLRDTGGSDHLTLNSGGPLSVNQTLDLNGRNLTSRSVGSEFSIDVDSEASNGDERFAVQINDEKNSSSTIEWRRLASAGVALDVFDVTNDTDLFSVNDDGSVDVHNGDLDLSGNAVTDSSGNLTLAGSLDVELDGSSNLDLNGGDITDSSGNLTLHGSSAVQLNADLDANGNALKDTTGNLSVGSKLDLDGNDVRLTEDFDLDMQPGLDSVEFRDTNNGHTTFRATAGDPGKVDLLNADLQIRDSNAIIDDSGDVFLTINSGGPLGVSKTLDVNDRAHVATDISGGTYGQTDQYPLFVENTNTGTSSNVLGLKVGNTGDPGSDNKFVEFLSTGPEGGTSFNGHIDGNTSGGVTYSTSGADYAEYLPRRDAEDDLEAGDVVGVVEGEICHETDGATRILVVSDAPAVTGNLPDGDTDGHETVAFTGQVSAKVRGTISAGDLVVPSGEADGTAVAVDPTEWDPGTPLVGRAWEGSDDEDVGEVTVAVGIDDPAVVATAVEARDERIDDLRAENEQLRAENEQLRERTAELEDRLAAVEAELGLDARAGREGVADD